VPYVHPLAQQNEKAGREEAQSEESQHHKEKNMADQWTHTKESSWLKKTKMFVARPEGRELEEVNQSMNKGMCSGLERQRHALARWATMQDSQQRVVVNQLHTKHTTPSSKMRRHSRRTSQEALP